MLKEGLLDSGRRFAHRAVKANLAEEWQDFYADAGTGLEHLAKAFLASYHPTLAVGGTGEGADFDTLLFVLGFKHLAKKSESKLRTVSCKEAIDRCKQLLPRMQKWKDELNVLVDARNGVLHLAHVGVHDATRTLVAFAQAAGLLLDGLAEDPAAFWGDYYAVIETRVSESASEVERVVADKVAQATAQFRDRYNDDQDAPVLAALRLAFDSRQLDAPHEQELECPACGTTGIVEGYSDVEAEPEWDVEGGDAYVSGVSLTRVFFPAHFRCNACDLRLEDDELTVAGVADKWELEEAVEPEEFWEPDEDLFRDR